MITIALSADGTPTIWNADDWLSIRKEHRIVGSLIGILGQVAHQDIVKGLPCTLSPEEATLLVERKVARLVVFPSLKSPPQDPVKEAFEEHRETTYNEQYDHMRGERKRQLELVVDRIVEGRRKKLQGLDTKKQKKGKAKKEKEDAEESPVKDDEVPVIDRNTVLEEELAKMPPLSKENTIVQTFTAFPWLREEDACPAKWTFPKSKMEKLRYNVFKDLWERGYYISRGHKFGGDFLVYPGDPTKFHSQYIVSCVDHNTKMNPLQLVSYGRAGSTVRKGWVLASMELWGDKPIYQTIYWSGCGPL